MKRVQHEKCVQGKGTTRNECDMKDCNVKSAQCEEKQRKKGHHEVNKKGNRSKVKVQTGKSVT